MNSKINLKEILKSEENESLELKAVLPPSRSIGQILCAFANSSGGKLILGVNEANGRQVSGLSKDFHASSVTKRAIEMLSPTPAVSHGYVEYEGKTLYLIEVHQSSDIVSIEGKSFRRDGGRNVQIGDGPPPAAISNYPRIRVTAQRLEAIKQTATGAKTDFVEHIQSTMKIVDDLARILYPESPRVATNNQEGKILTRILFSSCADTFESYLSDLLYEIYLANPSTLKSNEQVSIIDVLNCADIQEFVDTWARRKLSKLQRGSVKGFLSENKQISSLSALGEAEQDEIERILQIRHLYSHKRGIVDEKFQKFFPGQFSLNEEHNLSIDEVLDKIEFLADVVDQIDKAAIVKFQLASVG